MGAGPADPCGVGVLPWYIFPFFRMHSGCVGRVRATQPDNPEFPHPNSVLGCATRLLNSPRAALGPLSARGGARVLQVSGQN